jgi:hypothetical protein
MDIDNLTDDDLDRLASKLAGRLPTGRHGDKIVTTRRQLLAATAGGSAGVAALVKLGIDPATAQSAAGQVGTASSPEDVFAYNLDVQNGAQFNGNDIGGVGSLSTEQITNNETIREIGLVDFGTVSGTSFATQTVSFVRSYDNPPGVLFNSGGIDGINSPSTTASAEFITTSDFRANVYNGNSNSRSFNKCVYMTVLD